MRQILSVLFLGCMMHLAHAQTATPISGYCIQGGTQAKVQGLAATNYHQGVVPNCTVTVYLTGTQTLATLYSNSTGTPLSNPFTASGGTPAGYWQFYPSSATQAYDVVLSGGTCPNCFSAPVTIPGISVTAAGNYCALVGCTMSGGITGPIFQTGTITGNSFTMSAQSDIPASWTLDVTSPATALQSLGMKTVYTSDYSSLNAAYAQNSACVTGCVIVVNQAATAVTASISMPYVTLEGENGGYLTSSTAYTVTPGALVSPPVQLVAGSVSLAGLLWAYPEWAGTNHLGPAISWLVAGGSLILQPATTYVSDNQTSTNSKAVNILGGGKPQSNHANLIAGTGTIIQGAYSTNQGGVTIRDVGFDCGTTYEGATQTNCLDDANVGGATIANIHLSNVYVLGQGSSSPYHDVYIANATHVTAEGVSVEGNVHGFVSYATDVHVTDFRGLSNGSECLYYGSNSTGDGLGGSGFATNVYCSSVVANDLGNGVAIVAKSSTYQDFTGTNIQIHGQLSNGVEISTSNTNTVLGVNITNSVFDGGGATSGNRIGIHIDNTGSVAPSELSFGNIEIDNQDNPIFMGLDSTITSFSHIHGQNFTNAAYFRGVGTALSDMFLANTTAGPSVFYWAAGSGYYSGLQTSGSSVALASGPGAFVLNDSSQPVSVTFTNAWANYGSGTVNPSYVVDRGVVRLNGRMSASGVTAAAAFTLPAGARPTRGSMDFAALGSTGTCDVNVTTAGVVSVVNYSACAGSVGYYVSLDGITIPTY